jgi:hypothetical protein
MEEDFEKYELQFECNNCNAFDQENFSYEGTVSNGEVWLCKFCKNEILVNERPNEDK